MQEKELESLALEVELVKLANTSSTIHSHNADAKTSRYTSPYTSYIITTHTWYHLDIQQQTPPSTTLSNGIGSGAEPGPSRRI